AGPRTDRPPRPGGPRDPPAAGRVRDAVAGGPERGGPPGARRGTGGVGGEVAQPVRRPAPRRSVPRPLGGRRRRGPPVGGRPGRGRTPGHAARAPGGVGGARLHLRSLCHRHGALAGGVRPAGTAARRRGQGQRMTTATTATPAARFAPGSLVRARGREWIVLPGSSGDVLRLRPLSGSEEDAALLH